MTNTHSAAVERALRATAPSLTDAHAPLVELCRELARQMDVTSQPGSRLVAAYLSALKDLRRTYDQPLTGSKGMTRLTAMRQTHQPQ